jgi:16S rRNA (cytosine967-C5)-methyltransferase
VARLAASEQTMLRAAADAVRPGGRLVYATCSSEPDENDCVVDAFLDADTRFAPAAPAPGRVPAELLGADGRLRTLPFRDGLDAYFAAILVRSPAA